MSEASEASVATDVAELALVLGLQLDEGLLELALTHRSYAYEHGGLPTNERLEFLGDSVLGLAVTDLLYRQYPGAAESELARMRSSIVSTRSLAALARTLGAQGLGSWVRLGRGERLSGGADKDSILADTLEAVLGAVFVELGFRAATALVERLLGQAVQTAQRRSAGTDWKTTMQEEAAERSLGPVAYRVEGTGPDHAREFTAVALIGGEPYGQGVGRSKKEAEQGAAAQAYQRLVDPPAPPPDPGHA